MGGQCGRETESVLVCQSMVFNHVCGQGHNSSCSSPFFLRFSSKSVNCHVRNHVLKYDVHPIDFECSESAVGRHVDVLITQSETRSLPFVFGQVSLSTAIAHLVVHLFSCVFLGKPVHCHVRNHVLEYEVHPIDFECSRCYQNMGIFILVCQHKWVILIGLQIENL